MKSTSLKNANLLINKVLSGYKPKLIELLQRIVNNNTLLHMYLILTSDPNINVIRKLNNKIVLVMKNDDGMYPLHCYLKHCNNIDVNIIKELKTKKVLNMRNKNNNCSLTQYIVRCENNFNDITIIKELKINNNINKLYGRCKRLPIETYLWYNNINIDIVHELVSPINLNLLVYNDMDIKGTIISTYLRMSQDNPRKDIIRILTTKKNINLQLTNGHFPIVDYIIHSKTNIDQEILNLLGKNIIDDKGNNVLMIYLRKNIIKYNIVCELATIDTINTYNIKGDSALSRYLKYRNNPNIKIIKLLRTPENINKSNHCEYVPLTSYILFCDNVDINIIKLLATEQNIKMKNCNKFTPLNMYLEKYSFITEDRFKIIQLLK